MPSSSGGEKRKEEKSCNLTKKPDLYPKKRSLKKEEKERVISNSCQKEGGKKSAVLRWLKLKDRANTMAKERGRGGPVPASCAEKRKKKRGGGST